MDVGKKDLKVGQVLAQAINRGIITQREFIAQLTDYLLPELRVAGRQRSWTPEQADLVITGLILHRQWGYALEDVSVILRDPAQATATLQELQHRFEALASHLAHLAAVEAA